MKPILPVVLLALCGCTSLPPVNPTPPAHASGDTPAPAWPALARANCPMTRALDGRAICAPDRPPVPTPQVRNSGTRPPSAPRDFVVIGSFADRDNAERWARRNAEFGTAVRRTEAGATPLYRVVVGPLDEDDSTLLMREILATIGLGGSWPIALCAGPGPACNPGEGLDEASLAALADS